MENIRTRKIFAIIIALLVSTLFVAMPLSGCAAPNATYYTVTFDSNGGTAVESQSVKSGKTATRPAAPTRDNCTFKDWYRDTAFETVWNFKKDKVTSDITLYAAWNNLDGTPADNDFQTPVDGDDDDDDDKTKDDDDDDDDDDDHEAAEGKVTATFNVGRAARLHGLSNPAPQVVDSGSTITAPKVSISGYSVTWKKEGKKAWDFKNDKLTNNTTFYAEWSNGSGGSGTSTDYTPASSLQSANTVYIHYYRPGGDYDDWDVYAWNGGSEITVETSTKDGSGAVFAIPFSRINITASSTLNFIVAQIDGPSNWNKDGGDNSAAVSSMQKLGSSYHWYVSQGSTASGKNSFSPSGAGSLPETLVASKTESLRASKTNVNRATAAALSPAKTVEGWDETGVGYQIFVASFCDSDGDGWGDLKGITSKLDYLHDDLNVDVLWLTPVQKSPSNHGYDCYDYYSINDHFGTDADYRELVYQAHQRDMKIIMDLVVNHTSPQNEWFIKSKAGVIEKVTYQDGTTATVNYRDFYRWKSGSGGGRWYSTGDGYCFYSSFGSNMPELNYDYQPVRDAMVDLASYWMAYGLDGFRMDAVKHLFMWDESDNAGTDKKVGSDSYEFNETKDVEFFKEFDNKLKKKYPNCFLLGEHWEGAASAVAPFYAGMDSLFDFNTYYDLPRAIMNTKGKNVTTESNQLNDNAKLYAKNRGSGNRAINSMMSSNHDIDRLNSITSDNVNYAKLYISVIMTMPGVSWIYYGDEIGLKNNGSGDNAYRQSMKWDTSYSQKCDVIGSAGTNSGIKGVKEQKKDSNSLLSHVMAITKIRNDYPALISGEATCSVDNGMLKIVVKKSGEKTVTVYHNFSSSEKPPSASGTCVFGSKNLAAYGTAVFVS